MEEFLIALFEQTHTPELFEYNTEEKDYIHQILLPVNQEDKSNNKNLVYMDVQTLLEQSFTTSGVLLKKRPPNGFIVKMPVAAGKLVGCAGIIPNLTLNLHSILEKEKTLEEDQATTMTLSAVICLKKNHFTAFVRSGKEDTSPWIFMDSSPTNRRPKVAALNELNEEIQASHERVEKAHGILDKEQPEYNGIRLLTDCYMCIYI